MRELTIKGGMLLSPIDGYLGEVGDMAIRDGKIIEVGTCTEACGEVIDATGLYVTPGFIDIHTHCWPGAFLGLEPDVLGIDRGSTTIVDAGSTGVNCYKDFLENDIEESKTKVFTLLNISNEGLMRGHELDDPAKIDVEAVKACINSHRYNIVGLKARASSSVVGAQGLAPIAIAADVAHELGIPLMVHVGNCPPVLGDVIDLLQKGDIVTHAFHGKPGGILNDDNSVIEQAIEGRRRGVLFDIGHGEASFSFGTFQTALEQGFDCDSISTDLHALSYQGPVFDIATTMSKLIACGESLENAISKVTSVPASHFDLDGLGRFAQGMVADINLVSFDDCDDIVRDSMGNTLALSRRLHVRKTVFSRGEASAVVERA